MLCATDVLANGRHHAWAVDALGTGYSRMDVVMLWPWMPCELDALAKAVLTTTKEANHSCHARHPRLLSSRATTRPALGRVCLSFLLRVPCVYIAFSAKSPKPRTCYACCVFTCFHVAAGSGSEVSPRVWADDPRSKSDTTFASITRFTICHHLAWSQLGLMSMS